MKKIKFTLLMLLVVMLILPACKKGENDPLISLKSRKARLVGEWKLVEGSSSVVSSSGTDTYTFNGTVMTSVESGLTTTAPYSESYIFEKDGTYKYSSNMNNGEDTDDESGAWTFGTKSTELDVKAKETVLLYGQQYTSVSSGNTYTYSYVGTILPVKRITLDMLKSNKMTLLIDYTYTGTSSAFTRTGTWTYEKQ
jgi:hypothetical protein